MILFADETNPWGWPTTIAASLLTGFLGSLLTWYVNRKKPHHAVVKRIQSESLTTIAPNFRKNVKVYYVEKEVTELSSITLRIENAGDSILKNLLIILDFGVDTRILGFSATESLATAKKIEENKLQVEIPGLNSYRLYEESVVLGMICDGPVSDLKVSGRGEDWVATYNPKFELLSFNKQKIIALILLIWVLCFLEIILLNFATGIITIISIVVYLLFTLGLALFMSVKAYFTFKKG